MILLISDHGSYLGKSKEQFKVSYGMADKPVSFIPAVKVDGIIVDAKITISSGAFDLLRNHGITVIWQDHKYDDGMILQPYNSHGSVEIRRSQYSGLQDTRGVIFASKVVYAACKNKLTTIKRLQRNRIFDEINEELISQMEEIINEFTSDDGEYDTLTIDLRQYLMNTEARLAKIYYQLLDQGLELYQWSFDKRSRRPAKNPFNAMLNYGYAILKGRLTQSIAIAGLDIYGGFLHTDRSGRESLVLDCIEEFRQIAVDEVILKLVRNNRITEDDFEYDEGIPVITKEIKQIYVPALFEQFKKYYGSMSLSHHFIHQARHLASFLRGIDSDYTPFLINQGDTW